MPALKLPEVGLQPPGFLYSVGDSSEVETESLSLGLEPEGGVQPMGFIT